MNPFIEYESVKAGMRLYCMIHDEIGVNEFMNKIHQTPIIPAFKIILNGLDDGMPMEYADPACAHENIIIKKYQS